MDEIKWGRYGLHADKNMTPKQASLLYADLFNQICGTLKRGNCPRCLNRGAIAVAHDDGQVTFHSCDCVKIRQWFTQLDDAGLESDPTKLTFWEYESKTWWQTWIKRRAVEYARNPNGWMLICGPLGSGKTHLGAAVCHRRIWEGDNACYMNWWENVVQLKSMPLDSARRERLLNQLKQAPVLFVDDLFKCGNQIKGSRRVSKKEIAITLDILEFRSAHHLPTVISAEKGLLQLVEVDEEIACLILEESGANVLQIDAKIEKTDELQDGKAV